MCGHAVYPRCCTLRTLHAGYIVPRLGPVCYITHHTVALIPDLATPSYGYLIQLDTIYPSPQRVVTIGSWTTGCTLRCGGTPTDCYALIC